LFDAKIEYGLFKFIVELAEDAAVPVFEVEKKVSGAVIFTVVPICVSWYLPNMDG
jgi:hypothetical protein